MESRKLKKKAQKKCHENFQESKYFYIYVFCSLTDNGQNIYRIDAYQDKKSGLYRN